jgi:preprotein translocase subunit SecA
MRLFGAERIQKMMDFVKFTDETPIEAGILSRSIENAQSKVENHNYEIRKQVLEYDDVMNKQREVIYAERRSVLEGKPLREFFIQTLNTKVSDAVDTGAPPEEHPSEWDLNVTLDELQLIFPVRDYVAVKDLEALDREGMKARLSEAAVAAYEAKEAELTPEIMRMIESQYIMLPIIDRTWVDHLYIMDALKSGIGLRGYGQKDPRVEYEKEAYEIFEDLKTNIADEAIKAVFSVRVEAQPPEPEPQPELVAAGAFEQLPSGEIVPQAAVQTQSQPRMDPVAAERLLGPAPRAVAEHVHTNRDEQSAKSTAAAANEKVGRNELCPCGSGKKFKRCHGAGP